MKQTSTRSTVLLLAIAAMSFVVSSCDRSEEAPALEKQPNLILVLIDTLRADHLGVYGYERDTSPRIDEMATTRGIVFEQARSVAPWTNPTIASIFTGLYPQAAMPAAVHSKAIKQAIPVAATTLAEKLQAAGYETLAFIDHPGMAENLGFARGFETFVHFFKERGTRSWQDTPTDYVLGRLEEVLSEERARPFFLYLHLVYPHRPYSAPKEYRTLFGERHSEFSEEEREGLINSYDGEIRYTDDFLGDFDDLLGRLNLNDVTWRVLVSDHGEAFWEHGESQHGGSFHDEVLRVPLIFWPPDESEIEAARVSDRVSVADVHPTLLELAGLEAPRELAGVSLVPRIEGKPLPRRSLFSESPHKGRLKRAAIVDGDLKLIDSIKDVELFDLEADPAESRPLDPNVPEAKALLEKLEKHRDRNEALRTFLLQDGVDEEVEPDPETLERLRALGYVD